MPRRMVDTHRRQTRHIDDLDLYTLTWVLSGWSFPVEYPDRPTRWGSMEELMEDYANWRDSFLASEWVRCWYQVHSEPPWIERCYRGQE